MPRSSTGSACPRRARFRYRNADMADLEAQLVAANGARRKVIVTDGVFSMDGYLAPLDQICDLADKLRRAGPGRRLARRRLHRRGRPRHPRALRRDGPGRHPHRHPRQGPRRRLRRLRQRPPRDRRPAAPALPALPLLQRRRPRGRRGLAQGPRDRPGVLRGTGVPEAQHRAVPRADDRGGVRPSARRTPHHAGDVPGRGRRAACGADRRRDARPRASTSSPSPIPSSPRARRESGCSCRRRTPRTTCAPAWLPSSLRATAWARSRRQPHGP